VLALADVLTDRERVLVKSESLAVSDSVRWALAKHAQLGRLMLEMDRPAFRDSLRHRKIDQMSIQIARKSTGSEFSEDPVDESLAATIVAERIPLPTQDRKILKSRIVPFPK